MGVTYKPAPVKLIIGFIFKNEIALRKSEEILEKKFGKIDFKSQVMPFDSTDYYKREFGDELKRKFISFNNLISASKLSKVKIITNIIENKLSRNGLRLVNIDPGYIDMAKLILASTKDFSHRIYLNKGIYAEITLYFQNKSFRPWPWTYPDYRKQEYLSIFNQIRDIFNLQTCKTN